MTAELMALPASPIGGADSAGYRPGVCNIGTEEIARRRRIGHLGLAVAIVLLVALIYFHAPPIARLLVALPAAGAAAGYLQAFFRFCVAFGSAGVFNFGQHGTTEEVDDDAARGRDRARATQLSLAIAGIGVAAGIAAVLLPI